MGLSVIAVTIASAFPKFRLSKGALLCPPFRVKIAWLRCENAARFSRENQNKKIDPHQVKKYKKNLYAPLLNGVHRPHDVLFEVQKTTFPYDVIILKSETSLKDAVSKIENIRNDLIPNMGARDARELMRLRETRCIAQLVELFLRASIHRTETRGSHYREDYPERFEKIRGEEKEVMQPQRH